MKSIFTGILFVLAFQSFGQSNYSIADTSKSWSNLSGGYGAWMVVCCLHNYFVHFSGDTIVNSNRYLKVFQATDSLYSDDAYMGLMFEDTVSQEVYFRDPEGNEGLMYDFSISVGDTINVVNTCYNYERMLVCLAIDSLIIDDQFKKRFSFSVNYSSRYINDVWIEDIGSMNGILYPGVSLDGGFREFLCYKYSDTLIYTNPIHQTCRKDAFYPYIIQDHYDTAYLYYPYEFEFQITDTTEIDNISWYGWEIPPDFVLDQVNGKIIGVPTQVGSFFCAVTVTNWNFHTDNLLGNITVINPTSVNSPQKPLDLHISPNPCTKNFFIDLNLPENNSLVIRIYDLDGRKKIEKLIPSNAKTEINASTLPNGVYIIELEDSNRRILGRSKFIKI